MGGGGGHVADLAEPCIAWRKSTASNSGNCVEVGDAGGSVLVRDSAKQEGSLLRFSLRAWSAFVVRARVTDPGSN
jgi:3-oxoacyl-[acyl-carrier-protein] synthase III